MQCHVWIIMVKWSGLYWGIESPKAYETKAAAVKGMRSHPFYAGLDKGTMKVVKFVPGKRV